MGRCPSDQSISSGEMEAPSGFEPEMEVLQTSALPLGDGADQIVSRDFETRDAGV